MTLYFHLPFSCADNERLRVVLYILPTNETRTLTLTTADGENHIAVFNDATFTQVRYRYEVVNADNKVIRRETISPRRIEAHNIGQTQVLCDHWGEDTPEPALLRGTFADTVFKAERHRSQSTDFIFRLFAPEPPRGYRWAVSGSSMSLGLWEEHRAIPLTCTGIYRWEAAVSIDAFGIGTRYKYLLIPEGGGQAIWEDGNDRVMADAPFIDGARYLHTDTHARFDLPPWRGAGVVIPVFSLRSKGSQGIGDFGDLYSFVEWAASCGMRAVQVLPINDTTASGTWTDSYPYSTISVFALHPLYIDLREWRGCPLWTHEREAEFAALEKPVLDYDAVYKAKMSFLREIYAAYGDDTLRCNECQAFIKANHHWLPAYAAFSYLRDTQGTVDFQRWGDYAVYDDQRIRHLLEQDETTRRSTGFYVYLQYLLHVQMTRVHNRARELGVVLKGDIPIGVSPCGADAWMNGRLFHFDGSAGAPPDFFSRHGQNWGFPTYNWEAMAENGYAWWQARFAHMAHYFDAYRLDHVLGFFRIWEIPATQLYGVLGRFRPALPYSREELMQVGFSTNPDDLCRATFNYATLAARLKEEEIARFFTEKDGHYSLKEEVSTQTRVFRHTRDKRLRKILCDLCEEVLFIRDTERPDHFHPRIMAQGTARYNELPKDQQKAFDHLHDNFFFHRHNEFWAVEAMKKLPALIGDPMLLDAPDDLLLPCAEDLGFVPASVPSVLADLHILTLEIQRMPKAAWTRFGRPAEYPYLSVCATGTHDMSPFRLWWQEDRECTQAYWHEYLGRTGDAPDEATPEVCEVMMTEHLDAPSMLCLQAIQDWLALSPSLRHPNPVAEQINNPANPQHNWAYRLHLPLETLRAETGFTEKLRSLIVRSGRIG